MYTLEIYQWSGELCFASAAISIGGYLPQIAMRGKHKSLMIYKGSIKVVATLL
jgi:hypothetical protein